MRSSTEVKERTVRTPHGEKTITTMECAWCNSECITDNVSLIGFGANKSEPDIKGSDCGKWNLRQQTPFCDDCLNSLIDGNGYEWERTGNDSIETSYGEVEYTTKTCKICDEERTVDEMKKLLREPDRVNCIYTSCKCGNFTANGTFTVCEFCEESLRNRTEDQAFQLTDEQFLLLSISTVTFFVLIAALLL